MLYGAFKCIFYGCISQSQSQSTSLVGESAVLLWSSRKKDFVDHETSHDFPIKREAEESPF